jgi:dihydrofolate reductase
MMSQYDTFLIGRKTFEPMVRMGNANKRHRASKVDRVEVSRIPVLLGGGIPLLPSPAGRALLKLRNQRWYQKAGTVGLEYDIVRI